MVSIDVRLATPLELVNEEGSSRKAKLIGFVQELAVRANDEPHARVLSEQHVRSYDLGPDQKITVRFVEIGELADGEAPADAIAVWFASGRSFYSEE